MFIKQINTPRIPASGSGAPVFASPDTPLLFTPTPASRPTRGLQVSQGEGATPPFPQGPAPGDTPSAPNPRPGARAAALTLRGAARATSEERAAGQLPQSPHPPPPSSALHPPQVVGRGRWAAPPLRSAPLLRPACLQQPGGQPAPAHPQPSPGAPHWACSVAWAGWGCEATARALEPGGENEEGDSGAGEGGSGGSRRGGGGRGTPSPAGGQAG